MRWKLSDLWKLFGKSVTHPPIKNSCLWKLTYGRSKGKALTRDVLGRHMTWKPLLFLEDRYLQTMVSVQGLGSPST